VVSIEGEPVDLVNILLYNAADSTFITGTVTNQDGEFSFRNLEQNEFYIKLSSIGYLEAVYPVVPDKYAVYVLKENTYNLNEVTVTAAKPIVRVDDGKLSFDVPSLIQQRPINSAFDVLGEIPGIEKTGERIHIIGANSTTIIVNNRVSPMSTSQLIDYLKSIPPEQVKSIELLYVTPPGYGVKGSSINIVIDNYRKENRERKAQLTLQGNLAHYFSPSTGFSYSSADDKSLLNVIYSYRYDKKRPTENLEAIHSLDNILYDISLENTSKSVNKAHNIGLSYDYDLKNKDIIKISYNARINDSDTKRLGLVTLDDQNIESVNKSMGPSNLHNFSINYTHSNLLVGMDYSYYNNKNDQYLTNFIGSNSDSITWDSKQVVNQGFFYVTNQHTIKEKQKISYGINARISNSENNQSTLANNTIDNDFSQEQSEYSIDGFVGWSHSLGKKISFNANMSLEYHKANVKSKSEKYTLWVGWNFYPTLSMVYKITPMKILQLSFLSEKRYPTYWQTTPNVTYMNYYIANEGNPNLKPARIYSGRLNYILKGKYIFQLFGSVSPDYIQQSLYQSSEKLQAIYKIINLDKHNTFGMMAVYPFKAGQILDSKVILSGFLIHDKGELEDVLFNRKKVYGRISMSNNIYLNTKKSLSVQVNGSYATKATQGIYDIKPMYNLSAGVVWSINERLRISMLGDDLLNGRKGRTSTKIQNQSYNQVINNDSRMVSVSVRYNIGGYKEKKSPDIDTSRLGI
jgi:hypothetical protein